MHYLYNVLVYFAAPIAILAQIWRGLRDPSYRGSLAERLGFGPPIEGPLIWVHAVSVGEVQASQGLVAQLRRRHPKYRILMTTVTPTGAARVRLLLCGHVHRAKLRWHGEIAIGLNGQSGAEWAGRTIAYYDLAQSPVQQVTEGLVTV